MKKLLLTLVVLLFVPLFLHAQADDILGIWLTEKKTSQVEIMKTDEGRYYGKIVWLDEPLEDGKPKVDDENPDPELQSRPILGLQLVENFRYSSKKGNWQQGLIYDPDNGKTYDCFAWFENGDKDVLYLKGYVMGIKMLGRSTIWTRDEPKE